MDDLQMAALCIRYLATSLLPTIIFAVYVTHDHKE